MSKKNKILIVIIIILISIITLLFIHLYKMNKYLISEKKVNNNYHTAVLKWKAKDFDNNMQECIEVFTYTDNEVVTHRTIMTFRNEELANNHYNELNKNYYNVEINSNTLNITENISGSFSKELILNIIAGYEEENDSGNFIYEIY